MTSKFKKNVVIHHSMSQSAYAWPLDTEYADTYRNGPFRPDKTSVIENVSPFPGTLYFIIHEHGLRATTLICRYRCGLKAYRHEKRGRCCPAFLG